MPMPNKVKVFPRGYSGGQADSLPSHRTRSGDPEINRLFDLYTQHGVRSTDWTFRREVVKAAKRLMSGHTNWFTRQDSNRMVTAYNYQFLLDTVRFIATGQRRISIHSWPDLLSNVEEEGLAQVSERHDIADLFTKMALSTSADAMIQKWCSQRKGFDDMMNTLFLLFGEIHVRDKE